MNCAIYARVSTRDKGQDFTNQLLALREFAAKQGWMIYREYVDQVTGSTDERPEFRQCSKMPASASSMCCSFGVSTD